MTTKQPFKGRQNLMARDWPVRRARKLRRNRICEHVDAEPGEGCTRRATTVDHITPRSLGGGDEDSNLASLCAAHHKEKTAREGHEAWAVKKAQALALLDFSESHPAPH